MGRRPSPKGKSLKKTQGDLEKSISLLIETGSTVNASESKREQSGIIRRHFRGIKRREQFFEVPISAIPCATSTSSLQGAEASAPADGTHLVRLKGETQNSLTANSKRQICRANIGLNPPE